jgi:4-hydroxy-2-oxovalerate aldolase
MKCKILEVTIRDGSYVNNFQFTTSDVISIATALEDAGIDLIEVGHGLGLGASPKYGIAAATDEEYLSAVQKFVKKAKYGVMILPGIGELKHLELAAKYGVYFVRVAPDITEVEKAKPYVKEAKKLGMKVSVNMLKSYILPPKEVLKQAEKVEKMGADIVYLVDSAGGMFPEDLVKLLNLLRKNISLEIGFHGHNNLSLALINALKLIEAGIDYVDTSLHGMGRSAGNVQTEQLVWVLEKKGYKTNIDLYKIMDAATKIIKPLMPEQQGVDEIDILYGYAEFHSSFEKYVRKIKDEYNLDFRDLVIAIGKKKIVRPTEEIVREIAEEIVEKRRKEKLFKYPRRLY